MPTIQLAILDEDGGNLLIDSTDTELAAAIGEDLQEQLGDPSGLACAVPDDYGLPPVSVIWPGQPTARIWGIWHESAIEGPGFRSVVGFQGCPIQCPGCIVPQTWDAKEGHDYPVSVIAQSLLDDKVSRRDGVTIIGGEPFAQPEALSWLISQLRARQPSIHILVYSGFTLEALRRRGPDVEHVLNEIDVLIDGPYVQALHAGAGPWTGSGNQRVIDMAATRAAGHVVLLDD